MKSSKYTKSDLDRIATETSFIRDNLEKVLRLSDILEFLNRNTLFKENLTLKGGTAINLTIFNLPRLSVDIDLDFTRTCNREEMLKIRAQLNKEIVTYMNTQGYSLSPGTKNPHSLDSWVFYYQNAVGNKDNIKIEINYSMRNHALPLIEKQASVKFLSSYNIRALDPLELFGSKIKALLERTAPRDLYDVYNMLEQKIFDEEELPILRKLIIFYCAVGGSEKPKADFNFDSIDNLKYPQIRSSLIPVLRKSEKFDFEDAKTKVKEFLSKLMVLTENEKEFIETFNNNSYQPELLFEDKDIVERIKEHPMAIWKTRKEE